MRIAMVSEHASPLAAVGSVDAGGQNVHVAALATALARAGHEVVVHTRRDDPTLPRRVAMAPGVVVDHVEAGPPTTIGKDDLLVHMGAFADDLRRQWRHDGPDVVHAHFWMSGLASLDAAAGLDLPVAQTFHALGVVKRRHQGARDPSPPQRLQIESAIVARVDRIVATCRDELDELLALGADPARIRIVPCGVDLDAFTPAGPADPPPVGRRRIAVVGRLVERKGIDDVLSALADLPDVELVVAGGAPADQLDHDPDAARLRALAERLGIGDRVDLRGQVERAAVPALLRSCDAVVCAPWYEPFGMVAVEAMACGVPVVAAAVGGLLDTVIDGVTGIKVPARRPELLAAALARLLADEPRRAAMGAAGARRARVRYGWPRIARATAGVYRELLDELTVTAAAPQVAAG